MTDDETAFDLRWKLGLTWLNSRASHSALHMLSRSCVYCCAQPEDHAKGKCCFEATRYKPYGRKASKVAALRFMYNQRPANFQTYQLPGIGLGNLAAVKKLKL